MKRIVTCLFAVFIALPLFTTAAKSDNAGQTRDFGNRLRVKQYVGAGVFIPMEGDIDVGPSAVLGFSLNDIDSGETLFMDVAFSESGLSDSVLWTRGNARQTLARFGYKKALGSSGRWRLGADIQSHRMDFGSRTKSAVTFGALVDYGFSKRWAAQLDSGNVISRSGINFGAFHLMILREL